MPPLSLNNQFACINCTSSNVTTIDSRPADKPGWRRRRKSCNHCGTRWSTIELPLDEVATMIGIVNKLEYLRDVCNETNELITELMREKHAIIDVGDVTQEPQRQQVSMETHIGFPGVVEAAE